MCVNNNSDVKVFCDKKMIIFLLFVLKTGKYQEKGTENDILLVNSLDKFSDKPNTFGLQNITHAIQKIGRKVPTNIVKR